MHAMSAGGADAQSTLLASLQEPGTSADSDLNVGVSINARVPGSQLESLAGSANTPKHDIGR
ncbi:MAG: hypothetical protein U0263_02435 [Polyangiaceae bacterium]